jgi:hypothetical protein
MSDLGGGYNGNASLKRLGVEISYTEEQVAEIVKCSEDPIYFIKNYVKIVNVDKGLIPFDMWPFQENMVNTFHNNRFCIAKMPRQVGKCLQLNTPIRLRNKRTGEIIEMTIGEFYEQQSKRSSMSILPTKDEGVD